MAWHNALRVWARVWAQVWVSNLGLGLFWWILSVVVFGSVAVWIRIWDPSGLFWALFFYVFWNLTLVMWFFDYLGRRLLFIRRLNLCGVCIVDHTANYIYGRFLCVRHILLLRICMVDHTISYFSLRSAYHRCLIRCVYASSYVFVRILFPCIVAFSLVLVIFNSDVVFTSISCIYS